LLRGRFKLAFGTAKKRTEGIVLDNFALVMLTTGLLIGLFIALSSDPLIANKGSTMVEIGMVGLAMGLLFSVIQTYRTTGKFSLRSIYDNRIDMIEKNMIIKWVVIGAVLVMAFQAVTGWTDYYKGAVMPLAGTLNLSLFYMGMGFVEEPLFRYGLLMMFVILGCGAFISALFSSTLFALYHLYVHALTEIVPFIAIFASGLALSVVVLRTKRLSTGMFIHGVMWNFIQAFKGG